ncbi:MAG: helix-turn-helix domain-containing protein [Spirochaetia bacterium]|nr:helix-turn-helix domain-containing protein [Spirochaetia bacterium]
MLMLSSDYFFPGKDFHFGRNLLTRKDGGQYPLHGHEDYEEIFLIDKGKGVHLINGRKRNLEEGDLVFVRRRDRHAFRGEGLLIANLSFREKMLQSLADKYFSGSLQFYGRGPLPRQLRAGAEERHWLGLGFQKLQERESTLWDLDSVLMRLFGKFERHAGSHSERKRPSWVGQVLDAAAKPEHFQYGTKALAELAERSPENLSREIRRWTGKTPTDILNEGRLSWASEQLQKSEDPIPDLSLACGFDSLSYFYRLFRKRYGLSPLAYRQRTRRAVGR